MKAEDSVRLIEISVPNISVLITEFSVETFSVEMD